MVRRVYVYPFLADVLTSTMYVCTYVCVCVCKALYDDAISSLLDLAEGEHDFRRLAKALYQKWKDLEEERTRVG